MALDAHARPPEHMKVLFKRWQKCAVEAIDQSDDILDFSRPGGRLSLEVTKSATDTDMPSSQAFDEFVSDTWLDPIDIDTVSARPVRYQINALPGLFVYPALLPRAVQLDLLDKLLHRDLSRSAHKSNLHLHYHVFDQGLDANTSLDGYKNSFFLAKQTDLIYPKDPVVHKPLTMKQVLERKLRWVTLGGQYDWTAKVYPEEVPPQFPSDIKKLLRGLFPDVDAQAAIVNLYTPGDTLSVHRDVSEECDRGLVSISIGCDGIFIIGDGDQDSSRCVSLRLRSGDVILMSGESRYAWHAVPRILSGTCPNWLQAWPAGRSHMPMNDWEGWMSRKRINVNVRQMKEQMT